MFLDAKAKFQAPQAHTQPSQVNPITVYVIFFLDF
jgi:hypothetical protein